MGSDGKRSGTKDEFDCYGKGLRAKGPLILIGDFLTTD